MTTYTGTSGNDTFVGGSGNNVFHMEQGGNDTVSSRNGRDEFYFGASFTSADRIDGGGDLSDRLFLRGQYDDMITLGKGQIIRVEILNYDAGFDYSLKLENGFNGVRTDTYFWVGALNSGPGHLIFDGTDVKNVPLSVSGTPNNDLIDGGQASDRLIAGSGDDIVRGQGGDDIIEGRQGADLLTGGAGADWFAYNSFELGFPRAFDTITDFDEGDRIDLSAIDTAFHLGRTPNHVGDITVNYNRAIDETVLRLFTTGGDNKPDLVIHLDGRHLDLTPADFISHG